MRHVLACARQARGGWHQVRPSAPAGCVGVALALRGARNPRAMSAARQFRFIATRSLAAVCAVVVAVLGLAASSAHAGTANVSFRTGEYKLDVPAGVTTLHVIAAGGAGSNAYQGGAGRGALVIADLAIPQDRIYYLLVGGHGQDTTRAGGGGGGASDVRTTPASAGLNPDTRVLVAAGGGGNSQYHQNGLGGDAGQPGTAGGGGGPSSGGKAGIPVGTGAGGTGLNGENGAPGTLGMGGAACCSAPFGVEVGGRGGFNGGGNGGANADGSLPEGGGGGGGGLNGGGGGGSHGGGGGGSNKVPPGGTATIDDTRTPRITLTYPDSTPPVITLDQPPVAMTEQWPEFRGQPGWALGDIPWVGDAPTAYVSVYKGKSVGGSPLRELTAEIQNDKSFKARQAFVGVDPLPEGYYTIQARQTDTASNVGLSPARTFYIDRTAPALSLDAPAADATVATATPALTGTAGHHEYDDNTFVFKIWAGTEAFGAPVNTLTVTPDPATGTYSVPTKALPDGTYFAAATQSDSVGWKTDITRTFTIDTTAPAPSLSAPGDQARTADTLPTFTGTAATGAGDAGEVTVRVFAGDVAAGTPVSTLTATPAAGSSAFSVRAAAPLAEGAYVAQVTQVDAAGNAGAATRRFTIDATAPAPKLTTPANGAGGVSAKPTFAGTASNAPDDSATVTIKVFGGKTATGTLAQTITAQRDPATGAFTAPATLAIARGTYTAQVSQADDVGNVGTSSVTFVIGKPAIRKASVKGKALRFSLSDPADIELTFKQIRGKRLTTRAKRKLKGKAGPNSTRLPKLKRGSYQVEIVARDDAGNPTKPTRLKFKV